MQIRKADSEGVFYLEREAAPLTQEMINHASVFVKLQLLWDPIRYKSLLQAAAAQSTPSAKWHWTLRQGRASSTSVLIR